MRRPSRDGGQATVELVLVLPVVVLALLLVIQVGLVVRAQVLVVDAARAGARAASVSGTAGPAVDAARRTPGLHAPSLDVAVDIDGAVAGAAWVRVTYRVPTDVALVGRLVGSPTISSTVVMGLEGSPPG